MMRRSTRLLLVTASACLLTLGIAAPATADPEVCIIYDFAGSKLCVSENGIDDQGPLLPEPEWYCVTYDFAGGEACVSTGGQIDPGP